MSWRDWVRVTPRTVLTVLPGRDVQVTAATIKDALLGTFPQLHVHAPGQDVPEQGVAVDPGSSSEDLEHLADQAERWARELREAARTVRDREDSEAPQDQNEDEDEVLASREAGA